MMKIRKIISAESEIAMPFLLQRINSRLNDHGYVITHVTSNGLSFKDDNWQIRSKDKVFKNVDKGKFQIFESSEKPLSRIEFTYYVSFLPETIIGL